MDGVILSKCDKNCAESLGLFNNKNEIVTLDGSYLCATLMHLYDYLLTFLGIPSRVKTEVLKYFLTSTESD